MCTKKSNKEKEQNKLLNGEKVEKKSKSKKGRPKKDEDLKVCTYVEFILYPDNLRHANLVIPRLKSNFDSVMILHDKDVYAEDVFDEKGELVHKKGDLKKKHYHCIAKNNLRWTLATFKNQFSIAKCLGVEDSIKARISYFLHDTLECFNDDGSRRIDKAEYYIKDIICTSKMYSSPFKKALIEIEENKEMLYSVYGLEDILSVIINNDITEFYHLVEFCNGSSWLDVIKKNYNVIKGYLDSKRCAYKEKYNARKELNEEEKSFNLSSIRDLKNDNEELKGELAETIKQLHFEITSNEIIKEFN